MQDAQKRSVERPRCCHVWLVGSALAAAVMLASPAGAQITFTFEYSDPAGVGFNAADPLGATRRAALEATGTLLANSFPGYTANVVMSVNGAETNDATLAAAGSNFNSAAAQSCTPGYNRGDVGIKVLGGTDPDPSTVDGSVTVNFEDVMWDFDDSVSPGLFDFKSTMLHELLHAMGFSHSVSQTGTDPCGQAAPAAGGWEPYDEHLGNTTKKFIDGSFVIDTAAWNAAVTGGTGTAGVLWRGANGVMGNGGAPVPMFSPTTFQEGSSVSHLDDDFFTSSALLMEAATGPGPGTRTLSDIEIGILRDTGYTNAGGGGPGPGPGACTPNATTMCLENDNFEVTGTIVGQQGTVPLQMVELTPDTGYSWFLGPQNLEIFVKVLNGCGINGKYWVFFGGLTNLQAEIQVNNTLTGQVLTKNNPARTNFQTESNTSFFDGCPSSVANAPPRAAVESELEWLEKTFEDRGGRQSTRVGQQGISSCVASATTMCLENDNFEVTGTIVGQQGAVPLQMVELTPDTGYSWFLGPQNLEIFVKVLNGCSINNRYWVFFGGLTNLQAEIQVYNTLTGQVFTKSNPARTNFQTESNTSFFEGCDG